MLTMRELSRVYRTDTVETTALDRIDLDIADGEFVAIMGPSGCGKSTLLNVIGMLDSPSSGSYVFDGAVKRQVRLGRRNADYIEVLEGLEPGERVITSPYTGFADKDRLDLET